MERPWSDRIPSLLGIGRHPAFIQSLLAQRRTIEYSTLVAERSGTLFWKTSIRDISVWTNRTGVVERHEVELGRGVMGSVFPTAVLDSGVPLILTSSAIANAIYGAVGVGPGSDGQCKLYVSSAVRRLNEPLCRLRAVRNTIEHYDHARHSEGDPIAPTRPHR